MYITSNRRSTMKASMTAAILFFVLGVSLGRSRFSSSEVYGDADDVTIPSKFTDCEVTYHSLLQAFNCVCVCVCVHSEPLICAQLKEINCIIYIFLKPGYFAKL